MAVQKIQATTQKFTEIREIVEDVVVFTNNTACTVIEIQAVNFALLSKQEQDAKIYAYASLLNSLSFPIQIFIQSKKIDISSYLKLLDEAVKKTQNDMLSTHILLYKDFVEELVRVNTVLDKKFYIIIPYSYLEKGVTSAASTVKGGPAIRTFIDQARNALHSKTNALLTQLATLNLASKTLDKEGLIKLFYGIYNEEVSDTTGLPDTEAALVQGGAQ